VDIYLDEIKLYPRRYLYRVFVDGQVYDSFNWTGYPLTWSQQFDVASYYREGLS